MSKGPPLLSLLLFVQHREQYSFLVLLSHGSLQLEQILLKISNLFLLLLTVDEFILDRVYS